MKTQRKTISIEKENGRFYTPEYIVSNILDLSGYYGASILRKHVIDNSCGDGAFLCQIVKRYCEAARNQGYDLDALRRELAIYVHGIELEQLEQKKCINNVTETAKQFGIVDVEWDIVCDNAMTNHNYDGRMDFVLGNPPYVRVHNLGDSFEETKRFSFAQNGMTDLYIVFFEIGIKMLNDSGTLGYITPSSYFNSIAGSSLRNYLGQENLLSAIVDLKHFQAFPSTTYTAITILKKGKEGSSLDYYRFDDKNLIPYFVDTINYSDYQIEDCFFFAAKEDLGLLKKVLGHLGKCGIAVKNGYATLCDDVFIQQFDFESEHIIPVVKASKGVCYRIAYPYDITGKLLSEEELKREDRLYKYLLDNKVKLTKRSNEKDADQYWYAFGRSQAIGDTYKDKLAINSLLRRKEDFKFFYAPAGTGVYGGLYIVSETTPLADIIAVLQTDEFMTYVELLGKYKSGGYYTFSSKDVKAYLDYKFATMEACYVN